MKTVTFVSHYMNLRMNIRLSIQKYDLLMANKYYYPIELYRIDADRFHHGLEPKIFSPGQLKRLSSFLSGTEYWDNIL